MKTTDLQREHRFEASRTSWVAASPLPVALLDADMTVVEASEALVRLAGRPMLGHESLGDLLGAAADKTLSSEAGDVYCLRTDVGDRWVRVQTEPCPPGAVA